MSFRTTESIRAATRWIMASEESLSFLNTSAMEVTNMSRLGDHHQRSGSRDHNTHNQAKQLDVLRITYSSRPTQITLSCQSVTQRSSARVLTLRGTDPSLEVARHDVGETR